SSSTTQWLRLHIHEICDRIVRDREAAVAQRTARPPRHLNPAPKEERSRPVRPAPEQSKFLE
ncbi:MAG: haloacid dehalogenase-like hydrolase, partial [Opitutaceae bacterium]